MSLLKLSFACAPYDRIFPLVNGSVRPEGIDLMYIPLEVEEIFWRQIKHEEFDVSEMSLSSYIIARSMGDDRFIAVPVFTSRMFRHSSIYVNVTRGVNRPEDLKGKMVGVPEYELTAVVWVRGILEHEYGVHPSDIHWRQGGLEQPGRKEKIELQLPADIDYKSIPSDRTLSDMLERGELDAIISPRAPSCYTRGLGHVRRLFENFREVERDYYARTGIFPIMHTVVIKRSVYERHRWIAYSLFKAFLSAKEICLQNLRKQVALYATLPWLQAEIDDTVKSMGDDYWPYGLEKNQRTIETLCQFCFEQGLAKRRMVAHELFASETLDCYKI